jgi:WD40 repeat protein
VDVRVHQQIGATMPGRSTLALSPDGKTLAAPVSSGDDPTLNLWDVTTQRLIEPPIRHIDAAEPGKEDVIYRVAFDRDGATLATAALSDDGVRQWDAATHREIGPPVYSAPDKTIAETMEFSPDGRFLAFKGTDSVRFWDVAGRRQIGSTINIPNFSDFSLAMAFSPDNRILAVGSAGLTVRLFDTATRRQLGPPVRVGSAVHALAFSPDSKTLATGGADRAVRLWDVAGRRQLGTPMVGHTGVIRAIAFSPDGKALVTGAQDDTARQWDLTTYRQIGLPLTGHTDMVVDVAYSPDGSTVATASEDKTTRLWNVAIPADLAAATCANAGRSFTRAEWRRFIPGENFRQVCH